MASGIAAVGRNSVVPVLVAFKTPVICRVCHLAKHRLKLAGGMGLSIGSA